MNPLRTTSGLVKRCLLNGSNPTDLSTVLVSFTLQSKTLSAQPICVDEKISKIFIFFLSFDNGHGLQFDERAHQVGLVGHHLLDVFVGGGGFVQVLCFENGVDNALLV